MDLVGVSFGPFVAEHPLGRGGMSEVWAGRSAEGGTRVAIKLIAVGARHDETAREALRNEVHAHSRLDHPSIVRIVDFGEAPPGLVARGVAPRSPYLVTDLAEGGTLARGGFPVALSLHPSILLPILAALAHAHARGVIHRDLKPSNVLFSAPLAEGGRPQLCDFGIASALRSSVTHAERIRAGTPRFMAPEQILDRPHAEGPETDLYALGCLAYVLATGRAPFDGPVDDVYLKHILDAPPRPHVALPDGYGEWIATMLAKEPALRFPSAAHAARALLAIDFGGPLRPASATPAAEARTVDVEALRGGRPSRWPSPEMPARHDEALAPGWLGGPARPRPSFSGLGLFGLRTVPLAAREREQQALFGALSRVATTGLPHVALLRGGPGVGKTRLSEWLRERVTELGIATPLFARFSREHGPTEGFVPMMVRMMRCPPSGDSRPRITAWIGETGLPSELDAEDLLALVEERHDRFPNPADRHRVMRRALARLAERLPVVLHLDDVSHSRDAIRFVQHLSSGEPLAVLVVLTARDDDVDAQLVALAQGALGLDLPLGPLDDAAQTTLVDALLGLDRELAADVVRRTAGNPLFAVQLVRDWVARRALVPGVTGFALRDSSDARVPDDVHAYFDARIRRALERALADPEDRERARRALEVGALLGPMPDLSEWSGAAEALDALRPREALTLLSGADLGAFVGDHFTFAHELVRESLERGAIEGGREVALHAAIAAELERAGRDPERVALHFLAASDPARALPFAIRTAESRLRAGDFPAVHAWVARAHDVLDVLGAPPTDPRRAALDVTRAEACVSSGKNDVAEALLVKLTEHAGEHRPTLARVAWLSGVLRQKEGNVRVALEHFLRAEALGSEADDPLAVARALYGRAECEKILGRLSVARDVYERAAKLFVRAGESEARVLTGLADVAIREGDIPRAISLSQRSIAHFTASGMRFHLAIASNLIGDLERKRGNLAVARERYASAIELLASFGSRDGWIVRINLALIDVEEGAYERAEALLLRCESELARSGADGYARLARCVRLPCLAARRAFTTLDEMLDEIEPGLAALVDPDVVTAFDKTARILQRSGETARARRLQALAEKQRETLAKA